MKNGKTLGGGSSRWGGSSVSLPLPPICFTTGKWGMKGGVGSERRGVEEESCNQHCIKISVTINSFSVLRKWPFVPLLLQEDMRAMRKESMTNTTTTELTVEGHVTDDTLAWQCHPCVPNWPKGGSLPLWPVHHTWPHPFKKHPKHGTYPVPLDHVIPWTIPRATKSRCKAARPSC